MERENPERIDAETLELKKQNQRNAMSFSAEQQRPSPNPPSKKRQLRWSDLWLNNTESLNHLILSMRLQSLSKPTPKDPNSPKIRLSFAKMDRTLLLSDDILFKILSKLPNSQRNSNFLVCKRWLNLQGRLVRSLKVLDWDFIESGRLISRFPNLTHVNLVHGCVVSPPDSGILMNDRVFSVGMDSGVLPSWRICEENMLSRETIDKGLKILASGCPNLRKLSVLGASELGLLSIAEECPTLQDLELYKCSDNVLRGIAACENLQVLKLVGNVDGFYGSLVSDIGLTILAQGCKRLVKLELGGCNGGFDGVKAIGQCCQMLEELTLCDHKMDAGWLAALPYCENLKTLRFQSCKRIDACERADEYLGYCPALEKLHLQKCQLRDNRSLKSLFMVCEAVREMIIQDCWGLDNEKLSLASCCGRLKLVCLEGCSLVTTEGLESAIVSWKELEGLKVESCKKMKDSEVSPTLSTLFSLLKELKWRPDTKVFVSSSVVGTGIGKKGAKFFKKWRPQVASS